MVGHEKQYVSLAYAENQQSAMVVMDALVDYETNHGAPNDT